MATVVVIVTMMVTGFGWYAFAQRSATGGVAVGQAGTNAAGMSTPLVRDFRLQGDVGDLERVDRLERWQGLEVGAVRVADAVEERAFAQAPREVRVERGLMT